MNKKTILFDLDDTLAAYSESLMEKLLKLQKPNDPPIASLNYLKAHPIHRQRMEIIKEDIEFWFFLPRLKLGFDILDIAVNNNYFVNIATKGPNHYPAAWSGKFEWCQKELSHIKYDVTITTNKNYVHGDILVDDTPDVAIEWLSYHPNGKIIMPEQVHNKHFTHEKVLKYTGSENLIDFFN